MTDPSKEARELLAAELPDVAMFNGDVVEAARRAIECQCEMCGQEFTIPRRDFGDEEDARYCLPCQRRGCPRCDGNGWHTVRNPDPLLRGVFEVSCEECHGHG